MWQLSLIDTTPKTLKKKVSRLVPINYVFWRRRVKWDNIDKEHQTFSQHLYYVKYITNQRVPGACNRSPGSKLLSITTQLHCGGHLGGRARLPDTILEDYSIKTIPMTIPMTIPSKFGSNWATGSRQDGFYVNFP
jgi:hypothetical protein